MSDQRDEFTYADLRELFDIANMWDEEAALSEEHRNGAASRDSGMWSLNAETCSRRAQHVRSIAQRIRAQLPPERWGSVVHWPDASLDREIL
jgi:hypothetical protein